jgi:hypothetical protein
VLKSLTLLPFFTSSDSHDNPFWEKSNHREEERVEICPLIMATSFIISTPGFVAYCLGFELTLALQMWFGSMQVFVSILVGTMSVFDNFPTNEGWMVRYGGCCRILNSYACRL